MNTNLDMLPARSTFVHTFERESTGNNAQKLGRMLPSWAIIRGGLNWY